MHPDEHVRHGRRTLTVRKTIPGACTFLREFVVSHSSREA
jgi:hypothetical protein